MSRFAALFVAFVSCTSNALPSGLTAADVTCPPDLPLTYASFGEVFVADNCLQCHTTNAKPRLDSQQALQDNADAIIGAAVLSTSMPRGISMVDDERRLLGEWLSCGAP